MIRRELSNIKWYTILLLTAAITVLTAGGIGLYKELVKSSPLEIDYDEFIRTMPPEKWIKIKHCFLDLPTAARIGPKKELYIPVRGIDQKTSDKVTIIMVSQNKNYIDRYKKIQGMKTEEEVLSYTVLHADDYYIESGIQGLIRPGAELAAGDKKELTKEISNIAAGFILMDDGQKPGVMLWGTIAGIGIILGITAFILLYSGRKATDRLHVYETDDAPQAPDLARITGMSHENLREELYQGAKFVTFEYCISLIIISLKFNSSTYFIIQGERTAGKSFGYSLISLLFGWWGIPWGPVYTIKSLINNFSGGKDVTAEFSALLEESDQGKEELVQKL